MKIIVLGMDNTGKTTLCRQLSKELRMIHLVSDGPKITEEEMRYNLNTLLSIDEFLQERCCFFEEMVYGKILRNHSNFSFREKDIIKKLQDVIIVYCRPHKKVIENWGEREQMTGVITKADELIKRWDKVINKARLHGIKVIKYDYTKETVFDVIAKL